MHTVADVHLDEAEARPSVGLEGWPSTTAEATGEEEAGSDRAGGEQPV